MVKTKAADPVLATNKKAFHDYHVLSRMEAGIELVGTEVKSCRARAISMADAHVRIERGQAFLYNVTIATYEQGNRFNHKAAQFRRLLLKKSEILKWSQQVKEKGLTIIPLQFYLKGSLVKVEIGLCQGKTHGDKRDTLRERQDKLDMSRAMKR